MEATCAPEFWSKEEMQIWRKASGHLTDRRESGTHTPHGQDRRAGWSAHLSLVDLVPVGGGLACDQHRPHTRAQWGGMRGASHGAHPWQEDATGGYAPLRAKVGSWGLRGGDRREALTSRKEQLAMSKTMQPRDQMSDFWLKEKLRASGAIQDFWKGSVGRREAGHV